MGGAVLAVAWVCMLPERQSVYVLIFFGFPLQKGFSKCGSLFSSMTDAMLPHWEWYNLKFAAQGA